MMFEYECNAGGKENVLGSWISVLGWQNAISKIAAWASARESRVVYICNAHSIVTALQDEQFREMLNNADMATPDGAPVAFVMRRQGRIAQHRINGPDLMWKFCEYAAEKGGPSVYLYGASSNTLVLLQQRLLNSFPSLNIVGAYSPPFRELTVEEDEAVVRAINASGAGVVWVGLGCPKQERWMSAHRGRIDAVMVGVGAAFDYHAGTLKRAPLWMQRNSLEWLYRLATEPRRLWRRYLVTNTLFIWHAASQLLSRR